MFNDKSIHAKHLKSHPDDRHDSLSLSYPVNVKNIVNCILCVTLE